MRMMTTGRENSLTSPGSLQTRRKGQESAPNIIVHSDLLHPKNAYKHISHSHTSGRRERKKIIS